MRSMGMRSIGMRSVSQVVRRDAGDEQRKKRELVAELGSEKARKSQKKKAAEQVVLLVTCPRRP